VSWGSTSNTSHIRSMSSTAQAPGSFVFTSCFHTRMSIQVASDNSSTQYAV
jgi:hypothetical protein